MQTVAIFRNQLFKRSEPFIADQAQQITRYRVLYVGRERLGAAPADAASIALSDLASERSFPARLWQATSRDPRPYLRLFGGRSPYLVHAHFGADAVYAMPLANRLHVPLVTTFHGYDATMTSAALLRSARPAWWNYVMFRRTLAARGDIFLCVSQYVRRRVVSLGFPEARTRVHYIGVDTQAIHPPAQRGDRPIILHVARLVEKKGSADLIAAFARVTKRVPDAELFIVGEGPLEAALRRQVQDLRLATAVRFLGPLPHPQVLRLMAQAWLFALPSVRARSGDAEGLGMVLLEAAANGMPAVANRHGGIPEVVIDGETGRLCAEHDVQGLAEGMIELLRNDSLRNRLGKAARARVVQHFDLKRQSAALEEIYQNASGRAS